MTGLARCYLLAHFGKSLMWHGGNIAFAFYLTEICGQSPATMAWLMATTSIINAMADGIIGTALAGRMTDGGVANRRQFAGAIAAGIAFAAFCAAGLVSEPIRLAYAASSLLAFRIAYATMDVPQNAMLVYIPENAERQEQLITARMMAGYTAQVIAAVSISSLLLQTSTSDALYFALAGGAIGFAAIGTALALRIKLGDDPPKRQQRQYAPAVPEPALNFLRLMIATAAFAFVSTFVIRAQAYIAALGSDIDQGVGASVFIPIAMAVGGLAGQPLWAALCRIRGVRSTLRIASAALIVAALLFGASASSGALSIAIATALFGSALGGTSFALWALLARDARDGNAARRFGIFTCTSKLVHALSAVALGAVLAGGDYRTAAGSETSLWLSSVVAAIGLGVVLLLLGLRFPLSRKDSCA